MTHPDSDEEQQRATDQSHTAQLAARYAHSLTTDALLETLVRHDNEERRQEKNRQSDER